MFSSIIGQGTAEHASWWLTEKRYRQLALKSQILLQVLVLRMQTKGSVEERILESSYQKRSLADRSITGKRLLTFCSLASCHSLEQLLVVSNISPRSVQHNPCWCTESTGQNAALVEQHAAILGGVASAETTESRS